MATKPQNCAAAESDARVGRGGLRWLVFPGIVLLLLVAARYFEIQESLKRVVAWVSDLGPWGPAIFVALYVAATVLLIPGSVLTLGAGAVFGLVHGTLLVSVASTMGASAAFLIARYLAREPVSRWMERHRKFSAVDRAVAAEGWKVVLLTRLSPVFPFTLLNYGFGLTRVRLGQYVFASWIGMLPGTLMYVYLGTLARVGTDHRARTPGEWALYGVGLLATVGVTVVVTRVARKALAGKIDPGEDSPPTA